MERFIIIPGKYFKFLFKIEINSQSNCRKEDEIEPEITPSKLLLVSRVKPIQGNPHWERRILRDFGLFGVSFVQ